MFGQNIPLGFTGGGGIEVHYLVLAGGGASGYKGGSGAGGLKTSYGTTSGGGCAAEAPLVLSPGTQYTITVCAGQTIYNQNLGRNNLGSSSISGADIVTVETKGGGAGAYFTGNSHSGITVWGFGGGGAGGCGGGAANDHSIYSEGRGGLAFSCQGYPGGNHQSGGGGGTAEAGRVSDHPYSIPGYQTWGGDGLASSILSTSNASNASVGEVSGGNVYYGGGGGGSMGGAPGGLGGGATSSSNTSLLSAPANTGGGGAALNNTTGGNGGSGVVILRMPTSSYSGVKTGNPNVYTEGSDTILVYKGSGTYTA